MLGSAVVVVTEHRVDYGDEEYKKISLSEEIGRESEVRRFWENVSAGRYFYSDMVNLHRELFGQGIEISLTEEDGVALGVGDAKTAYFKGTDVFVNGKKLEDPVERKLLREYCFGGVDPLIILGGETLPINKAEERIKSIAGSDVKFGIRTRRGERPAIEFQESIPKDLRKKIEKELGEFYRIEYPTSRKTKLAACGCAALIALGCGGGIFGGDIFHKYFAPPENKINYEDVLKTVKKLNQTLHEKGFSYSYDRLRDGVNLSKIIPYNFEITGEGFGTVTVTIDDGSVPKNVQTYKALVDLGAAIEYHEKDISSMNYSKFLKGEKENYAIDITIPVRNNPNDIIAPSRLVKIKRGDCEDYSLLYACYFNAKGIPAFIVIDGEHAVAAVGEVPSNPKEFRRYIKENRTFVIGSSEYVEGENPFKILAPPQEILSDLRTKYLSADVQAIISKDGIWVKDASGQFNVSKLDVEKKRAKRAAEYLGLNLSADEIERMADEFYNFYQELVNKAVQPQKESATRFYRKMKDTLNDAYEESAAESLFNE